MNKKLIALAVAGVMAAPMAAQAEITVSGKLQVEVASVSAGDATGVAEGTYVQDGMEYGRENSGNASAINIAGSQDLGGGMKAIAKAGFNLTPADHADGWGGRDAYVGLAGGFGTVLAGRMNTPYKASTVGWDPFLTTSMQARGSFGMSAVGHNGYAENVVAYANNFGDVKFVGAVSFDEATLDNDGDLEGDHTTTFSVNAPVGPIELALAYLNVDALDDGTATKVGAKYSTGAFTVAAQYEMLDEGLTAVELNTASGAVAGDVDFANPADFDEDSDVLYLTGSMVAGANTFSASWGQVSIDDEDADYFAIGAKHAFSKAVSGHVGYRTSDTDVDDTDVDVFAVGMQVGF